MVLDMVAWVVLLCGCLTQLTSFVVSAKPCRCQQTSQNEEILAFQCVRCLTVPSDLPKNTTNLILDPYRGKSLVARQLKRYSQLRELSILNGHRLSEVAPKALTHLRKLHSVVITSSQISSFPRLPHPVTLAELQGNKIQSMPRMHLPNLIEMDLNSNYIEYLGPDNLRAAKLHKLNMFNNRLVEVSCSHLRSLSEVDLSGNFIKSFPSFSPKIKFLHIEYNQIHNLPALELPHLEELYLSHNNLTTLTNDTFYGTPRLRILDLSHNPLEDIPPEAFANLQHLRSLLLPPAQPKGRDRIYLWIVGVAGSLAFLSALTVALTAAWVTKQRYPSHNKYSGLQENEAESRRLSTSESTYTDDEEDDELIASTSAL